MMKLNSVQPIKNIKEDGLIPFEIAFKIADEAVFAQTARHLKNIEVAVLRGALQGQKYDRIAQEYRYAPEYIKHDVGPKLWRLLSFSLGEKVSKTNVMAVLARQAVEIGQGVPEREPPPEKLTSSGNPNTDVLAEAENYLESPIRAIPSATQERPFLEPPVGVLPLDSAFYVERPPLESRCYEAVMQPGALIRIQGASQMGKTSLMLRILTHAQQYGADFTGTQNVDTVTLSLQRVEPAIFAESDRFLRWFCAAITRKLQLPHQVEPYWSPICTDQDNCTHYFEDCILSEINGVLVLALDQVDEVFLYPKIAEDFFSLLHAWYKKATPKNNGNSLWKNLRLIWVHTTEFDCTSNLNLPPFKGKLVMNLKAFTLSQVSELAQCYGLNLSDLELAQLMQFFGGHPFRVQQALYSWVH